MLASHFMAAPDRSTTWLLVALHGLGDSYHGYTWLPSALELPWLNFALVNAPDSYYGGYSWYDFASDPGPGVLRSRKLLTDFLDKSRREGFVPGRTFLFGFSQGCLMTIEVGLNSADVFAGLIGVSGYAHEPERLLRSLSPAATQQRFLLTHGTDDTLIPIVPVRQQIQQFQKAGLNIEWHEFHKDHTIIPAEISLIRRFLEQRRAEAAQRG
jgi:phospholipase/carboxylesterase